MIIKKTIVYLATFSIFLFPFFVEAQTGSTSTLPSSGLSETMNSQVQLFQLTSGFSNASSIEDIIATIIGLILSLLAIIFIILMIVSGYQWMTAGGNEEQVKKAQSRIKNAIIGLVVVILAYAITAFVFRYLPGGAGGSGGPQGTIGG